ncbi:hypothetical protein ACH47B_06605 [Rhodococcus sp. NPDC019627]|uniref:hypothetical protein n=1 Tax=unclassified Rhodococcus (in: high G+C Gram-positive bacteria) TaxID=192944 RepID=UPI003787DB59
MVTRAWVPALVLVEAVRPGLADFPDGTEWDAVFRALWSRDPFRMLRLTKWTAAGAELKPVAVWRDSSRVRNGHHRIAAAYAVGGSVGLHLCSAPVCADPGCPEPVTS